MASGIGFHSGINTYFLILGAKVTYLAPKGFISETLFQPTLKSYLSVVLSK